MPGSSEMASPVGIFYFLPVAINHCVALPCATSLMIRLRTWEPGQQGEPSLACPAGASIRVLRSLPSWRQNCRV